MEMIENFAALSREEQKAFAVALVKTINSESTFSDSVNFSLAEVQAFDHTGDLSVFVETTEPLEVSREARWDVYDEDELHSTPDESDVEYVDTLQRDVQRAFKAASAEVEGYKVTLEVSDVEEEDTVEVEVTNTTEEDSGIGSYEYAGSRGYDSHPYLEVEGNIVKACSVLIELSVTPIAQDVVADDKEEDEEAEVDNSEDGDFDPDDRRAEMPWDYGKHFD